MAVSQDFLSQSDPDAPLPDPPAFATYLPLQSIQEADQQQQGLDWQNQRMADIAGEWTAMAHNDLQQQQAQYASNLEVPQAPAPEPTPVPTPTPTPTATDQGQPQDLMSTFFGHLGDLVNNLKNGASAVGSTVHQAPVLGGIGDIADTFSPKPTDTPLEAAGKPLQALGQIGSDLNPGTIGNELTDTVGMTPKEQPSFPVVTGAEHIAQSLTAPGGVTEQAVGGDVPGLVASNLPGKVGDVASQALLDARGVPMMAGASDILPEIQSSLPEELHQSAQNMVDNGLIQPTDIAKIAKGLQNPAFVSKMEATQNAARDMKTPWQQAAYVLHQAQQDAAEAAKVPPVGESGATEAEFNQVMGPPAKSPMPSRWGGFTEGELYQLATDWKQSVGSPRAIDSIVDAMKADPDQARQIAESRNFRVSEATGSESPTSDQAWDALGPSTLDKGPIIKPEFGKLGGAGTVSEKTPLAIGFKEIPSEEEAADVASMNSFAPKDTPSEYTMPELGQQGAEPPAELVQQNKMLADNPIIKGVNAIQGALKQVLLGGSVFHPVVLNEQLARTALGELSPIRGAQAIARANRAFVSSKFATQYAEDNAPWIQRAVDAGATMMKVGGPVNPDAQQVGNRIARTLLTSTASGAGGFLEGKREGQDTGEALKTAGKYALAGAGIAQVAPIMNASLWGRFAPVAKTEAFKILAPAYGDEVAAKRVNDIFGGQNLTKLGRDPNVQTLLRTTFLAPDWLESWARNLGAIVKPGPEGDAARKWWAATGISSALTLEGLNQAINGHLTTQNEPGHQFQLETTGILKLMGQNPTRRTYLDVLGLGPLSSTLNASSRASGSNPLDVAGSVAGPLATSHLNMVPGAAVTAVQQGAKAPYGTPGSEVLGPSLSKVAGNSVGPPTRISRLVSMPSVPLRGCGPPKVRRTRRKLLRRLLPLMSN